MSVEPVHVPTAPAPIGGSCEWCWNTPAVQTVETPPPRIVQRGDDKGKVKDHAVVIRACADCAAKIEHTKADATGAADLDREAKNMERRKVENKPTRAERIKHLEKLEADATERGHHRTAKVAARLRAQVAQNRGGWRDRPA